jgi:putative transposase
LSVREVCRKLQIPEHPYDHWRREYGGPKRDQAKRLKELELENSRLKRVVAELTLGEAKVSDRRVCRVLDQARSSQRYCKSSEQMGHFWL